MAAQDYYKSFPGQTLAPSTPGHPDFQQQSPIQPPQRSFSDAPPPYSSLPPQAQAYYPLPPPQQNSYPPPPPRQSSYPPPPIQYPPTPQKSSSGPYQQPSFSQSQYLAPSHSSASLAPPNPTLKQTRFNLPPSRSHSSPPDEYYDENARSASRPRGHRHHSHSPRPHSHRHHSHSAAAPKSHKNRDTFLGGGAGAIVGDAIFPGLGTLGGLLLGGWGGYDHARRKEDKRELDERWREAGHGGGRHSGREKKGGGLSWGRGYEEDEAIYRERI
ncbi:MAG: hypothetical protein M1821_000626 [Bathelium mastoideum]|nr:MAG: hypothetical protein M1821_000626 [Bathelium mastoideum]